MKRVFLCILLCCLLVGLAGCNEEPVGETNPDGTPVFYDKNEMNKSPFSDTVSSYPADFFIGSLPEANEPLNVVDIRRQDEACVYQGKFYKKIVFDYINYMSAYDCFWQLDCNYLRVLGKNNSEEIVYAIGEPAETLLVVNSQNEPEWYVDDTDDILNPCTYSINDFDVEVRLGLSIRPNSIAEIWKYHTGKAYDQVGYLLMESSDFQWYFLRCKERPWLVYELRCLYTYDGFLYIYNVPNDGMILMNE